MEYKPVEQKIVKNLGVIWHLWYLAWTPSSMAGYVFPFSDGHDRSDDPCAHQCTVMVSSRHVEL